MALTTKQINIILSVITVVFSITLIVLISYLAKSPKQNITQNQTSDNSTSNNSTVEPGHPHYYSTILPISENPLPPTDPAKTIIEIDRRRKLPIETKSEYNPSWFDRWFNSDKVKDEIAWRKTLGKID